MESMEPARGALKVYLPRGAVRLERARRVLWYSLLGLVLAGFVLWIGFGQSGFGRPQWWVQLIAPIFAVTVVVASSFNVHAYLAALGKVPILTLRANPPAVAGSNGAGLWRAPWVSLDGSPVLVVERRSFLIRNSRAIDAVTLRLESSARRKSIVVITDAALEYDWVAWCQEVFAPVPGLGVRESGDVA